MPFTKYFFIPTLLLSAFLAGCSTCSTHSSEARERAQKAAQALIDTDHSDTIALENRILEAKSIQGEYDILGDSAAVRAFDESFREYMQEHDAALAKSLF